MHMTIVIQRHPQYTCSYRLCGLSGTQNIARNSWLFSHWLRVCGRAQVSTPSYRNTHTHTPMRSSFQRSDSILDANHASQMVRWTLVGAYLCVMCILGDSTSHTKPATHVELASPTAGKPIPTDYGEGGKVMVTHRGLVTGEWVVLAAACDVHHQPFMMAHVSHCVGRIQIRI